MRSNDNIGKPWNVHGNFGENHWSEIAGFFPAEIRAILLNVPLEIQSRVIEIRMRIDQPMELNLATETLWLARSGSLTVDHREAVVLNGEILKKIITALTTGSFYAIEDEIAQGYLSLPGGHRVGFTGHVLQNNGKIRLIRNISSLNFRIAKAIQGIARPLLPLLWRNGHFCKTIIISPPAAGKTTLLREIIRELSTGVPSLNLPGQRIGLVDERSEVGGCFMGSPQLDVGPRTDILDGCPKRDGVYLLLRAMNPQIIATDEMGGMEDAQIIEDIMNAGVSLITTAHARDFLEALTRPGLRNILEMGAFERLILLSTKKGVGTIESVKAGVNGTEMWPAATGGEKP